MSNTWGSNALQQLADYTVIDLETTGLSPEADRIIEVSCIRVRNHQPFNSFSMLVNPQRPVGESITKLTGITDAMLHEAPLIGTVLPALLNFIGDDVLIGHNISFDLSFITAAAERCGVNTRSNDYIDTLRMSRRFHPELPHHRLGDMVAYFRVPCTTAHRALADCESTHLIYECMLKEWENDPEIPYRKIKRDRSADADDEYTSAAAADPGYAEWKKADELRANGDYAAALAGLDAARSMGYTNPALFISYARVYRKLKDYAKEIAIIDEYMADYRCVGSANDELCARRERAMELQAKAQAELQAAAEKERLREERKRAKQAEKEQLAAQKAAQKAAEPKKPTGRAILQLTDDMAVVRRFESIAEAVRETGVNSKSIRDAANGVQKRAGGYVWRYEDAM